MGMAWHNHNTSIVQRTEWTRTKEQRHFLLLRRVAKEGFGAVLGACCMDNTASPVVEPLLHGY